jgi:hypothetical protein
MGITTHQKVQDIVVLAWHDVDCEQLFFLNSSNLHTLQQIRICDKSLVEKFKQITREKEEVSKSLICQREKNIGNVCCTLAKVGRGSRYTFWSCKSNTSSSLIFGVFSRL